MGKLYLVSTPIGNLSDVSQRSTKILSLADLVVCEDTRRTGKLLQALNLTKKSLFSLTDFNERQRSSSILERLLSGQNIALVSDAGTPLLSDPGYHLIRLAIENNIPLEVIPGPSAAVSSALISGLPPDRILFWGFLPKKITGKKKIFEKFLSLSAITSMTFVVFESPFRLRETITLLSNFRPGCSVAVVRELTKIHQEVVRGTPIEILDKLSTQPKGEITLAIRLDIDPKSH